VALADYEDLLRRAVYAHVATVAPNGTPRNTPVAFEWDGQVLRFSTTRRRQKVRDLLGNPRIAVSIVDPDSPFRHVQIRGTARIDAAPEAANADQVTLRYMGRPYVGDREQRVIVTVVPDRT